MAEKMNVNINATKLYLGDFPDEVLLIVMSHLTDMSLLQMAQVSKRFRRIAKESFAKRYSGESRNQFYPLLVLCENEIENQRQNRPFFCTFGENIHAIEIDIDYGDNAVGKDILVEDDHWLYDSIPIYCTALTKLHIRNARGIYLTRFLRHLPTLTHLFLDTSTYLNHLWTQHSYPKLISFELVSSGHHDERNEKCNLDEFFNKNRQLKRICMRYCMCDENILDLLSSGMNELESVELFSCYEIANQKSTTINISKLKSIVLVGVYSTFHVLNAISKGCKNIACLKMENMNWGDEWDDDAIQTLCSLEKLTSLQICSNNITVENLQKIIDRVPNLTSLCLTGVDRSSEVLGNLPFVVSICDKLVKLEFKSNTWGRKDVSTDFMQNIVDSIHRNNSEVTLQLGPGSRKLFFSQDQIRDGNALIYWAGCEANSSQSTSNLLDLGDECLQKIVGYLDIRSQSALYNTCTRTRKIVKDYIASHVYRIYDESILNSDESIFQSLGEHISRLVLVLTYCDTQRCMQFLSLANRYCSRITELTLLDSWFLSDQQFKCILPNLTKLVISEGRRINYQTLRSLECPMLTHLEIDKFEADVGFQTVESLNHDGFYRHLTTLKFNCYNESVANFLLGLEEITCQQMKVLSLNNNTVKAWKKATQSDRKQYRSYLKLFNILTRFRSLTALHILLPGVTRLNPHAQNIFELLPRLTKFEICCHKNGYGTGEFFRNVMKNCKEIECIKIFGLTHSIDSKQLQEVRNLFPNAKVQTSSTENDSS